ncbi:hypothetical protein [Sphingomonas sp. OK281]|uniref:alpha/beta hydrolase family protein n=1 Tax=Sphingomonas sp. OK281 TaxID=1881067 RepID=UPI0008E701E6|nr:hypothetical protein [Sphingomonas sp. OK281]SFN84426.1 hypothetical protein SAMN05428984_1085 [Sphingomonas sp. OK281]
MPDHPTRRSTLALLGAGIASGLTLIAFDDATAASPPAPAPSGTLDLATSSGRVSRVTHWRARDQRGTILFSHGALSSPAKYDALILPWVDAGFDVWAPLHVDSTDHPDTKAFPALKSWGARIEDMRALSAHVGGVHISAGHSYGALTALTMGGAQAVVPMGVSGSLRDPRTRAVVAFSPPGLAPGLIDAAGYAALAVPALIQTGTSDVPPGAPGAAIAADAWKNHLLAYDSATAGGDRFALVLDGADHYFGGLICRPELPGPHQAAQMRQAVAVSLDFLRGFGLSLASSRKILLAHLRTTGPVILSQK